VVSVVEVAELVDDDVVEDGEGRHHALPVEGEGSGGGAGGPAVAGLADVGGLGSDADLGGVVGDSGWDLGLAALDVVVAED